MVIPSLSNLGATLKRQRMERNLTLNQLADKSGVSRAAISKIERGDSGASTNVLGRLAEALGISISQLIGGVAARRVLKIAAADQPVFHEKKTGFERRSLSPLYFGRGVDLVMNTLPAKTKTGPFPSHSSGVEEHLYVVKGKLKVTLGSEEHVLAAGDFLFYQADLNHTFENLSASACDYLIAIDSTRLR